MVSRHCAPFVNRDGVKLTVSSFSVWVWEAWCIGSAGRRDPGELVRNQEHRVNQVSAEIAVSFVGSFESGFGRTRTSFTALDVRPRIDRERGRAPLEELI